MRKYIDAQVLIENIHRCLWTNDKPHVEWFVDSLPAADVEEVRNGRWILNQNIAEPLFKCSSCGTAQGRVSRYCPNCGARMEGEQNE